MKRIYANLIGNWVCLNESSTCLMGENRVSPSQWYEENAKIFAPLKRQKENSYYQLDYVHIFYEGKDYRINPIFIQIVES